jgi:hypothetical protein|tara:strand:- start:422 stop:967 length:546 start_codon:yes stop_codon:yes gene_type:complete
MVYRVVDKYVGGKCYEGNNLIEDTQYKKQSNTTDFVHHVINKGFPWQIIDGKPYGAPEGAVAGALVDTGAPVSWEEWLLASPGGALWAEWKDRIQADRNTIQEVFDVDTQTYTRTIDYDSEGNYNKLREIYTMNFGDAYFDDQDHPSFKSFAYVNDNFDAWRKANGNSRKHLKFLISKGNI